VGKHSTPKQSWLTSARDFAGAVATLHRAPQGRHSGGDVEQATATGVLRTVRQRPMVAAIALPAAATVGIVASTLALGQNGSGGTVTAEDSAQASESPSPDAESSAPSQEELDEQVDRDREAYAESLKEDDKYSASGSSSLKAMPKPTPSPTANSGVSSNSDGESAGSEVGDEGASSDGGSGSGGVSDQECSVSSSIESGLTPNGRAAYRAVCAEFPEVSSYGGRRADPGSDHNSGNAVDIMITGATGDRITEYLIANRDKLNVKYVIFEQKIYASYTGWSGRAMEDRGSVTANHYDHVHVSVN
jgi:hypothetical protein